MVVLSFAVTLDGEEKEEQNIPQRINPQRMNKNISHIITRDIDPTNLIHSLHPRPQDHPPQNPTRPLAPHQLPPTVTIDMFAIKHVFDDIELRLYGGRGRGGAVAFESREDFVGFVVFALADEETGGVGEEGTEDPD
jgi:hypothetical protein